MRTKTSNLSLEGRVVLITGGAGGIGSAVARQVLAKGGIPAAVDLDGPALRDLSSELGTRGLALAANVTDRQSMDEVVQTILHRFDRIDVAAVNAGIAGAQKTIRKLSSDEAENILNVNIHGAYNTISATMEQIIASRGHIIGSCSVASFLPWPLAGAYGASKAALESLMRTLRAELCYTGATAGSVYFGHIATPMMDPSRLTPAAKEYMSGQPKFLTKQISADQAATAVIRGIEGRRVRSWAPGYIGPLLATRGLVALADDISARRIAGVMQRADSAGG